MRRQLRHKLVSLYISLAVYCVQQLLITHESQIVYTEVQAKLPELRHYAAIDVNDKQCSELVKILERFTLYVISKFILYGILPLMLHEVQPVDLELGH